MGGRFWIGIILLLCLLITGLFINFSLYNSQEQMAQLTQQAEQYAHEAKMPQAKQAAQQAYNLWQQRFPALAAIADHEPLDEVDATFRQALAYASEQDTEEFSACCARLIAGIRAITQAHTLSWWNIL